MTTPKKSETLEDLARQIEGQPKKSDELVISAAKTVQEARRRVGSGEAGDITWSDWARENINLSKSRLGDLLRIAEADDPEEELERQRDLTRQRVEKCRAKKAAVSRKLAPERRKLIEWVKEADIEDVKRVLSQVRGKADEASETSPVASETSGRRQAA